MKKTVELLRNGFESSSYKTPEFLSFVRVFTAEFTKELKSIGAKNIKIEAGHFYVSGFCTSESGQVYYFSIPDVRGMAFGGPPRLMYRTAMNYTDFSGGSNQWAVIESDMAKKMTLK